MPLIDTYTKTDMAGQIHTLELRRSKEGKWSVLCWTGESEDAMSLHWEVCQKVTKTDPTGNRILEALPFTGELARAEFERWRN